MRLWSLGFFWLWFCGGALAQSAAQVVDIPTRVGVTQRMLVQSPVQPKAAVVLFAGGHGGLQISADGQIGWGRGNFLIRSVPLFLQENLLVVVVDAPSDRMNAGFLAGFRQTPEHVTDVAAVIAWVRQTHKLPVWLVGTSRGTQSVGFVATQLDAQHMPDGVVLTASILSDPRGRPVPAMAWDKLRLPVLVVHHESDGCSYCYYRDMPSLMSKLNHLSHKQLLSFTGGLNRGDPCESYAHHGFNGLESEVIKQIAAWVLATR